MTTDFPIPGGTAAEIVRPPRIAASLAEGPHNPNKPSAIQNWENEGGHFPNFDRVSNWRVVRASDIALLSERVRSFSASLSRDFADGRVGTRFNTYQHRERVLRQLTAKLSSLRPSMAGSNGIAKPGLDRTSEGVPSDSLVER